MKYILVMGTIGDDKEPWGGVIDVDQIPKTPEEKNLLDAIKKGLVAKSPWLYGEISIMDCPDDIGMGMFEKMPFTGTIEKELVFYVYP